jgi:tripartite-type tricarboxylate transporter receptor subunit TctC
MSMPLSASASTANKKSSANCTTANGIKIKHNAAVCKGLAYFKGQTMTWVNIGSVGGPFDIPGIALGPELQAYLGLGTWEVTSYTTGSSIPGQDVIARSTANGLTIGFLNPLADIQDTLENVPGINFNPVRMAFIGATGISGSALVSREGSGITSFAQLVSASKAGGLKELYEAGSLGAIQQIWMGVMGISTTYVSGYAAQATVLTGLLRGDGPVAFFNNSLVCPALQGNQVTMLASLGVPPVGTECRSFYASAPTLKQLEKQFPPKTAKQKKEWTTMLDLVSLLANPIVTQTAVPAWKLATLRAAVAWSYKQAAFKTTMLNGGQNPTLLNPVQAKTSYQAGLKRGPLVICYITGSACS